MQFGDHKAAGVGVTESLRGNRPKHLYWKARSGTVPRSRRKLMQTTFNDRWRRHDGFGLLAVAVIVAAAIAVGYLAGVR